MTVTRDMSDVDYHAQESLSASGIKLLLEAPALYRYWRDNPEPPRDHYDWGSALHTEVLGTGSPLKPIDALNWRTNAAKDAAAAARAAGAIPLLRHDHDEVQAAVRAVRNHPVASALFTTGEAEVSLAWTDPEYDVPLRARPDWVTRIGDTTVCVDLKSAQSSEPTQFGTSAAKFGYAVQNVLYVDAMVQCGLVDAGTPPDFLFVVVRREPPHLVTVTRLDEAALDYGYRRYRRAVALYRQCRDRDEWPGYAEIIHTTSLPRWATYDEEESA